MDTLSPILCFLFFGVFFLAAIGLGVSLLVRSRARAGRSGVVRRKIDQILRDFPDEVRAWGGPEALNDRQTVRAIIAKLERSSPA